MAPRRPSGLTLVETVVASFILATMILSVQGIWPVFYRSAEKHKNRKVAVGLATQQMEIALAEGFLGARRRDESFEVESVRAGNKVSTTFSSLVDVIDENPNLKTILVRVSWTEQSAEREVTFETKISR